MALSATQIGPAAATINKAKIKRQQGGMAPAVPGKPQVKPAARLAPDGINRMSNDGKSQTMIGPGGGMPRGVRAPPQLPTGIAPPQGGMEPGSQGGGAMATGMTRGPQNPDLMKLLPPKMQAAMAQNGRDPREAIASRMQNDPIFKQKMISMQQQGGFPGAPPGGPPSGPIVSQPMQPPPGGPNLSAGGDQAQVFGGAPPGPGTGPDSAVSGSPGQGAGGPMQAPPPGADIGGPMPQGGTQGGFGGMNQQQLRRMLPPAIQDLGFFGNQQNPQLGGVNQPPQPQLGGVNQPPQLGGVNPYRGLM